MHMRTPCPPGPRAQGGFIGRQPLEGCKHILIPQHSDLEMDCCTNGIVFS